MRRVRNACRLALLSAALAGGPAFLFAQSAPATQAAQATRAPTQPATGAAGLAATRSATQPAITPDRIAQAVRDLGSDSWRKRDEASDFLWRAGRAAEDALRQAARSTDVETAVRAKQILEKFRYGIYPDTPPKVLELLEQYHQGEASEKRRIVETLPGFGTPGFRAAAALAAGEENPELRDAASYVLQTGARKVLDALLGNGQHQAAGELLEALAASGEEWSVRNWAAFLLLRGELDKELERFPKPATPVQWRALVCLRRVHGDLKGALEAAARADDPILLEELRVEAADWPALAADANNASGLHPSSLAAAYHRLAGNRQELEEWVKTVLPAGGGSVPKITNVRALFLNDRPQEATDLLVQLGRESDVFDLLAAQERFTEALALAEKAGREPNHSEAHWLRCKTAALLLRLGEREKAAELIPHAIRDAEGRVDVDGVRRIAETQRQIGMTADAETLVLEVMERDSNQAWRLFRTVISERECDDAWLWWRVLIEEDPNQAARARLEDVKAILDGRMPAGRVKQLLPIAEALIPRGPFFDAGILNEGQMLEHMTRAALEANLPEEYQRYARKRENQHTGWGAEYELGNWLAERRLWKEAAEQYSLAFSKAPRPMLLFLQGRALAQAGEKERSEKLVELADLSALANGDERRAMVMAMEKLGLREAAARQRDLIRRTAAPRSFGNCSFGFQFGGWDDAAAKKYAQAANRFEAARIWMLRGNAYYDETEYYLYTMRTTHSLWMKDAIQRKDWDKAIAEADLCLKALPGGTNVVMDVVPELDRAGRKEDADRLFKAVWELNEKNCRQFPHRHSGFNNAAWFAARCHRELAAARAFAEKAVAAEEDNAGFLDTLAEVHFQQGDRAKAMELMKKCIELNAKQIEKLSATPAPSAGSGQARPSAVRGPDKKALVKLGEYLQRQLKRLESGDPSSKPE